MPYQSLIETLIGAVDGAQGALLMDATGEVVVEAGARDYRHRLIGAYQGIALSAAQRATSRFEVGTIHYILCRYVSGYVIARPLRDGYYLVVSLARDANVGQGLHRSAGVQERMNAEL